MDSRLEYLLNALSNSNIKAMQLSIRNCEGTEAADGYNYLFGSTPDNDRRFTDMTHHPNQKFPFSGGESDAAGAYQIMYETEQCLIKQLVQYGMSVADATMFDAPTQDLKCVLLFSNHNCCQKIIDGDFNYAVSVLNKTWASLPGSPYGQPVKSMSDVIAFYTANGGVIADAA